MTVVNSAGRWWRKEVFYEIYPRSFCDVNRDGVGELDGIRSRLDYLADLGVGVIWIAPFYPSPMADGGYDVSNFCDVAVDIGTLASFDRLLARAHEMGIRVITDLVANHTSDQHPWFKEARSSRTAAHRDWYIWRDQPNSWRAALTDESAWAYDERTGQYYLHFFLAQQPDLNWRNEEVVAAMHNVMRFWLDRGVDGFRLDAAQCLGKDPEFHDYPEAAIVPVAAINNQPYTHHIIKRMKQVTCEYDDDRLLLGEIFIGDTAIISQYCSPGVDELDLAFNFSLLRASWSSPEYLEVIRKVEGVLGASGAWPTWVLSNHDRPRVRTRFGGSISQVRAAVTVLMTLRGSPFLYQGEELGLEDALVPPDRAIDPKRRDGSRAPIPWTSRWPHGWNGTVPALPFPPHPAGMSVESQAANPASMLSFCRRLMRLRGRSTALQLGMMELLDAPPGVVMYSRASGDEELIVAVNFADRPARVPVPGDRLVVLSSSDATAQQPYDGIVPGETAFVFGPART